MTANDSYMVKTISRTRAPKHIQVSVLRPAELTASDVAAWRALEARTVEENPYLSPDFILPALQHLPGAQTCRFIVIRAAGGANSDELLGLGIFVEGKPTIKFPFRHLTAYKSMHSYLTGVYVDRDRAAEVLDAFAAFMTSRRSPWRGVHFSDLPWQSKLGTLLREAFAQHSATWYEDFLVERAILHIAKRANQDVSEYISKRRLKTFRRYAAKLAENGTVEWHCHSGARADARAAETFLRLEHSGWTGDSGTSLLAKPNEAAFFRDMIANFARRNQVFFTELTTGGRVVVSTCNLMAGRSGFAFKIGWDEDFRKYSPGTLNEIHFLQRLRTLDLAIDTLDSGASPESYIDRFWPDRAVLATGFFVTDPYARAVVSGLKRLRQAKRLLARISAIAVSRRRS